MALLQTDSTLSQQICTIWVLHGKNNARHIPKGSSEQFEKGISHHIQSTQREPLTDSGPDEGGRVTDVLEALAFDEIRHAIGEVLIVGLHIVLQYQATQGPRRFILVGEVKTNGWTVCLTWAQVHE